MKLLVDTNGKRVLFAEATKECVDFLFHILSLPVATLIRLLGKNGMVGSLANLYLSIEDLNDSYIQPNQTKDTFLKPTFLKPVGPPCGSSVPLLLLDDVSTDRKFYKCGSCANYVSSEQNAICPRCNKYMTAVMEYVAPPPRKAASAASGDGGFVKGVVTYMVMDDLVVTPMSTISSITLLNKFNVKEVGALEEKVVNMGMTEAVKLLNASLQSKKVLTDVFLKGAC
ncbi:hypothetical protein PHJA_002666100 [Phtheirospermum japonicum]|uniref:DUF674 domain-containing protein n=1 Tax=Phtheirospermum japonicum TaxID=374723 RepID=A0A830D1V4_9LAMI|nr:hypothetical protein PHJA_002666100 [Phtheirospermum japonicum]